MLSETNKSQQSPSNHQSQKIQMLQYRIKQLDLLAKTNNYGQVIAKYSSIEVLSNDPINEEQSGGEYNRKSPMDAEHNFVNRGQAGRVDYTPKNSSIRKMHSDGEYFKSNGYYDPKHISVLSPLELKYYAVEYKFVEKVMHDRQIMADYENQFNRLTDDIKQIRRELTIGGSGNSKQDYLITNFEKSLNEDIAYMIEYTRQIRKDISEAIYKKQRAIKSYTMTILAADSYKEFEQATTLLYSQLNEFKNALSAYYQHREETMYFMINSFGYYIIKLEYSSRNYRADRINRYYELIRTVLAVYYQLIAEIAFYKKYYLTGISALYKKLEYVCYKLELHLLR